MFSFSLSSDLFACSGSNTSIISDVKVYVGSGGRLNQPVLCSMSSPQRTYLQLRLKHFYDICAITTWARDSNVTETNFRIQYPGLKMLWQDYKEMDVVKVSYMVNDWQCSKNPHLDEIINLGSNATLRVRVLFPQRKYRQFLPDQKRILP